MLVAHPPCRPIHAGWMPPHTRFAPSIAVASGVASRHGRLMRQSCHRIGMAIFTALSPQVASARPLALLDGLAPFRCSSRERDMSMANITRRKKGFPAGEKGGRHHLHPLSLSPADTAPRGEGGKNASEWLPRSVPKLAAVHVTRAGRVDGCREWHLSGVDLCGVVNLGGGGSPNL